MSSYGDCQRRTPTGFSTNVLNRRTLKHTNLCQIDFWWTLLFILWDDIIS